MSTDLLGLFFCFSNGSFSSEFAWVFYWAFSFGHGFSMSFPVKFGQGSGPRISSDLPQPGRHGETAIDELGGHAQLRATNQTPSGKNH